MATSSPQASLAAVDVLRAGGNAVDAAIAASAVLCITEPQMTAIGGDCFALIGTPDGEVTGLNGSGCASRHADEAWLKASGLTEIATDNVHAITVPGAVDGWAELLDRFGTKSLGDLLQPAIRLARDGHPVGPRTAHDWAGLADFIGLDEGGRMHYLPRGKAPVAGQLVKQPALADTLEALLGMITGATLLSASVADAGGVFGGWQEEGERHGRWFGHHRGHRHDPERMRDRAEWAVGFFSHRVDATDEQEEQLQTIVSGAIDDLIALHPGDREERHAELMALLEAETVDRERLEQMRSEMIAMFDQGSQRVAQAVADAAEVLTPEQRAQVSEWVRRHHSHRH